MAKSETRMPELTERMLETFLGTGMTVTEFAKKVSKSRSSVYAYLYYGIVPDALGLASMSKALNVSADYLLFGK